MFVIAPTYVQDFALGHVELHDVCTGSPQKPVQVPLDVIVSLPHADHATKFGVIRKIPGSAPISTVEQQRC